MDKKQSKTPSSNDIETLALDLNLLDQEIDSAVISIIAYATQIISANKAKQLLLNKGTTAQTQNTTSLDPSQIAAISSILSFVSLIIQAQIAYTRLKERQEQIEAGNTTVPITPNINITTGYAVSILASSIRLVGVLQKALNPETPVTIL